MPPSHRGVQHIRASPALYTAQSSSVQYSPASEGSKPAAENCLLKARDTARRARIGALAGSFQRAYLYRAVYVVAVAGAVMLWVWAPPSDQELKV